MATRAGSRQTNRRWQFVVVGLNPERTKMVVESWHEGRGTKRMER